ncbi:YveK family protein [Blautia sp.]|uniref:YveK family protein n=1 Tax=Blautia sp. TaxID=1955243 RepID=UPI003AF4FE53
MENMHDDEMEIDLREIFYALKKRIFMILAVGLLCGCLSCVYTKFFMTPVYTSTSSMLVLTKETTLSSLADLQMGSQLTKDYTVLTTSREVLQKVIENQELNISYKALKSCITLDNPTDTRILNVSVTYPDAEKAKAIVDELANVASSYIGDKMEVIPPKIIEDGEIPTVQTSPSMSKNTMLGLLAGLILSAGIVVVITIMNDSIKTEDDIEKYLGISTLAVVPDRKDYIGKKKTSKKKKSSKGGRA